MEIGILDPKGIHNNPLNGEPYSDNYREIAKKWSHFPYYEKRYESIDIFKNKQVTLLVSGTGSGKTVLAPKFMLHALDYKGKIAITNPKRMSSESGAKFSAVTLDIINENNKGILGTYVSVKFRGSSSKDYSADSNLVYCTDGFILQKLKNDPLLEDYDCVIIDEAHERNINIDLLLLRLKQVCFKRNDFKLVIMSATINTKLFSDYYNMFNFGFIDAGKAPHFTVNEYYSDEQILEFDENNYITTKPDIYIEAIVDLSIKILTETNTGDILVFVTGSGEGRQCCQLLHQKLENNDTIFCTDLSASTPPGESTEIVTDISKYKEIENKHYKRKIIFSTEVAESSITIDGLKYVIDSGLVNSSSYDYSKDCIRLDKAFISKASHAQRKGRTGRVAPGECYNLFTEYQFKHHFKDFTVSPIINQNISSELLTLLGDESYIDKIPKKFKYNKDDVIDNTYPTSLELFLQGFIEKPPQKNIQSILDKLEQLDALKDINDNEYILTNCGYIMSTFGTQPEISRMLIESYKYGCREEITILAAYMEASKYKFDSIRTSPPKIKNNNPENDLKKYSRSIVNLTDKYGDAISIIKIYKKWKSMGGKEYRNTFCKENFLNCNVLTETNKTARQLNMKFRDSFDLLNKMYDRPKNIKLENKIILSIVAGYHMNIIEKKGKSWRKIESNDKSLNSIDTKSFVKINPILKKNKYKYAVFMTFSSVFNRSSYSFVTPL